MMDAFSAYGEYKESGIDWLGLIPKQWKVIRLKYLAKIRYGLGQPPRETENGLPLIRATNIKNGHIVRKNLVYVDPKDVPATRNAILRENEIVVVRSGALTADSAIIPESYAGAIVGYDMVVTVIGALPEFVANALLSSYMLNYQLFLLRSRAAQPHLNAEELGNALVVLPPLHEQNAIVRFLHVMDRKIRSFIRNRRRLIQVLSEQKQAIINRAVTRGINPNVQLKHSGIQWIGDMPAHWAVWQIGHFSNVGNGSTPYRGNKEYWENGRYPWLNSGCVNNGVITIADQFVTEQALRECHLPCVAPESVLVGITGQGKTRGMAAVLKIEATINQHIAYITPIKKNLIAAPEFLQAFLTAAYLELRRMSDDSGSTKGAITCGDLRRFRVLIPPTEEQRDILHEIDSNTKSIISAIEQAQHEIDLIREYRTRLISDVVTGKVDVRHMATDFKKDLDELGESDYN